MERIDLICVNRKDLAVDLLGNFKCPA